MFRKYKAIFIAICAILIITAVIFSSEIHSRYAISRIPDTSYLSNYSTQELVFAKNNLYTQTKSPKKLIEIYFNALKSNDRQTIWLLSSPEFPGGFSKGWIEMFDKYWSDFSGKTYTSISYSPPTLNCSDGKVDVYIDNVPYVFCLYKIGGLSTTYNEKDAFYTIIVPPIKSSGVSRTDVLL
jgi:hypothetical protein